ncbi:MAG: hypothetical protein RSB21_09685 [Eubacterium sp.]
MKKTTSTFLLIFLSIQTHASPEKELYAVIKGQSICVYTNDIKTKPYNNQVYLYLGDIVYGKKFKSTYSQVYKNIKMPISKNECISIDQSYFKNDVPYDIVLDMEKSYSLRICVKKGSKQTLLKETLDGYTCQNEKIIKKEKTISEKLLNWLKS